MESKCQVCQCMKKSYIVSKSKPNKSSQDPLQNWTRWLQERQRVHKKISTVTGRDAGCLVMNLGEEYRRLQEDKNIFENTNIVTNFEKFRGNPAFWKVPYSIPNKHFLPCGCPCPGEAYYFSIKTKIQKNEIPDIDYVATPEFILNEKCILPRTRNIYKRWRNTSYRREQIIKLSDKIREIQPHKPDLCNLVIIGQKIVYATQIDENPARIVNKLEAPSVESPKCTSDVGKDISSPFASMEIPRILVFVNSVRFSDEDPKPSTVHKFRLLYENMGHNEIHRKYLIFVNRGQTVLRLVWNKYNKYRTFRDLILDSKENVAFYFDKSELLLIPGKSVQFPVWFKPKKPGSYVEYWELSTAPPVWDDDFRFVVQLQGISYDSDFRESSNRIKCMLNSRMKCTLVKELLNEIYNRSKYTDFIPISYSFSEAQLFECANMEYYGFEKKPKYLFNGDIVRKLKKCYDEFRCEDDEVVWDYSAKHLLELARRKDVLYYIENQVRNCNQANHRRTQLQQIYKTNLSVSMNDKSSWDNKSIDQPDYQKESNYDQVQKILHQIERPCVIFNISRRKYVAAYMIIHDYLCKICAVLEGPRYPDEPYHLYNHRKVKRTEDLPDRLIFEKFDDIWVNRSKRGNRVEKPAFNVADKCERLTNIPAGQTKAMLSAYQTKAMLSAYQTAEEKAVIKEKETKYAKDEDRFKERKSKSKFLNKFSLMLMGPVKMGYDPFAEDDMYTPLTLDRSSSSSSSENLCSDKGSKGDSYDYDNYIAVYTLLGETVDALVDALETFKDDVVPLNLLAEISRFGKIRTSDSNNTHTKVKTFKEDDEYCQFLLESNLNENIEKYIIKGDTDVSVDVTDIEEEGSKVSIPNLFKYHESLVTLPQTTNCYSLGVQTVDDHSDYQPVSSDILFKSIQNEEEEIIPSVNNEKFYFINCPNKNDTS